MPAREMSCANAGALTLCTYARPAAYTCSCLHASAEALKDWWLPACLDGSMTVKEGSMTVRHA